MRAAAQHIPATPTRPQLMEHAQSAGCAARIDYPCVWQYKLIGTDRQAVQAAVSALLGDAPYSLSLSRRSGGGKYLSLNLEAAVDSEAQRLRIYQALADHPAVRMVL